MTEKVRLVIVRISGKSGIKKEISDTLNMLRLYKKYTCVVVPNTTSIAGMIQKIEHFVTWGEVNQETLKLLLEKRGRLPGKIPLTEQYVKEKLKCSTEQFATDIFTFKKEFKDLPGLKLFFKLTPPRFGFENKGTKKPFSLGGALGYRKDKINDLIRRMI